MGYARWCVGVCVRERDYVIAGTVGVRVYPVEVG
jgi:hypothetical protein